MGFLIKLFMVDTGKCMFYKIAICVDQSKPMYVNGYVSLCQPSVNRN